MEVGVGSVSDVFLYLYLTIGDWAGGVDSESTFRINLYCLNLRFRHWEGS